MGAGVSDLVCTWPFLVDGGFLLLLETNLSTLLNGVPIWSFRKKYPRLRLPFLRPGKIFGIMNSRDLWRDGFLASFLPVPFAAHHARRKRGGSAFAPLAQLEGAVLDPLRTLKANLSNFASSFSRQQKKKLWVARTDAPTALGGSGGKSTANRSR